MDGKAFDIDCRAGGEDGRENLGKYLKIKEIISQISEGGGSWIEWKEVAGY
jgi:hypothetical protein